MRLILLPLVLTSLSFVDGLYSVNFDLLRKETEGHKQYLCEIGLGERAAGIQVHRFEPPTPSETCDLSPFEHCEVIPSEVLLFDPLEKNTLITTDPLASSNDPEELERILDIRLYPSLRVRILDSGIEVFLGTEAEMDAYYRSIGMRVEVQFSIPSSATYYLAEGSDGQEKVILAGLVSRENVIAQLLTLKLAGAPIHDIPIRGHYGLFRNRVLQDLDGFQKQLSSSPESLILIIAGCGMQEQISAVLEEELDEHISVPSNFEGSILSLTYLPLDYNEGSKQAILCVDLVYGEIMEEVVEGLLNTFSCNAIFSGGAAGYLPLSCERNLPPIGTRVQVHESIHPSGDRVVIARPSQQRAHLQVPSIFLETYSWLEESRILGATVDVETFYILRAIQNHKQQFPEAEIFCDCGCFISDYVGRKALREYSSVYQQYPEVLKQFINRTMKSNPK